MTVIGGGMALGSGGLAAPVGGLVLAHGLDHFFTGLQTAFSGNSRDNVTMQLLQGAGMSAQIAGMIDSGLSISIGCLRVMGDFIIVLHSSNTKRYFEPKWKTPMSSAPSLKNTLIATIDQMQVLAVEVPLLRSDMN